MSKISRDAYASMYGPTTGDRVRLGDSELIIQVERDHTVYGDEVKFGGGKVVRDGMGQCQRQTDEVVDTVITNALILDHWGIVKADIGIKNGRIKGVGKAGNPDTQAGVDILVGPGTEVIAGEGMIVTPGGIDAHIHFICPQQVEEALMSGITTMLGTCTPGPWNIQRMLQAAEYLPMNLGFMGKGNGSLPNPLEEQIRAGAMGLKLHEDWGTPSPPSRAAASTPITPKAPAAAMRRTSSRRRGCRTCCRRPPIRRARIRSTPSMSIWTCSWSVITCRRPSRKTSPSPSRASAGRPSPPRTSCTTSAPSA